jgi:hypothetical protein
MSLVTILSSPCPSSITSFLPASNPPFSHASITPFSHPLQAPEAAAKLQPVCRALNIDKDDFASKRIMAAYSRISGECGVQTENSYVTGASDLNLFCFILFVLYWIGLDWIVMDGVSNVCSSLRKPYRAHDVLAVCPSVYLSVCLFGRLSVCLCSSQ